MVIKIDFNKAYDSVSWDFLESCLAEMALPANIIKCIMYCVRSPIYALLWNGAQTDYFTPSRGLRQGDPLSPYLFVIVMDKLSRMIHYAMEFGSWSPIIIKQNSLPLTHLMFADDVLFFAAADHANAATISGIL